MAGPIVEIAQINLRVDENKELILTKFQSFIETSVRHREGFLKRELLKKKDGNYLNLVRWESHSVASCAFKKAVEDDLCLALFSLLTKDEANPDSGVEYFTSVTDEPRLIQVQ